MLITIINKNQPKIFLLISNLNFNATTLNTTVDKKNLIYISKYRLLSSILQNINLCLIFYNIYIDNFITALNVEFNS